MAQNNIINLPIPVGATQGGTGLSSVAVNSLLYANGSNSWAALASANGGVLVTSNSGVPSILVGSGTTNTPLLATASGTPAWGSFALALGGAFTTAGALTFSGAFGVTFTVTATTSLTLPTSGTLATTSQLLSWVNQTSTPITMSTGSGYVANSASQIVFTLPSTAAFGSLIAVVGLGAGGWQIAQNSGQTIHFGNVSTTTGVGGSLTSSNQNDQVFLLCTVANTTFAVTSAVGNLTYV